MASDAGPGSVLLATLGGGVFSLTLFADGGGL